MQNFEKKLKDIYDSKSEKFDFIQDRLKDLKQNLDTEIDARGRMGKVFGVLLILVEKNLFQEMQNLEKNCTQIFDEHIKVYFNILLFKLVRIEQPPIAS